MRPESADSPVDDSHSQSSAKQQHQWWATDYTSVSWEYTQQGEGEGDAEKTKAKLIIAKPPFYQPHGGRAVPNNKLSWDVDADISLNTSLPGVRAALEALNPYEMNVGFHYDAFPSLTPHELGTDTDIDIDSDAPDIGTAILMDLVYRGRKMWKWAVRQLLHSELGLEVDLDMDKAKVDFSSFREAWSTLSLRDGEKMHRSTSTMSSIDFTDSDIFSMPATPKAKTADGAHIHVPSSSPSDFSLSSPSPPRPLNASASSFVPSFSFARPQEKKEKKQEKEDFAGEFTFASLNPLPPTPMVKIKKDEQGFLEVHVESSSPSSTSPSPHLLPPFLQEPPRRKSKTRQIVDRLRSQSQSRTKAPTLPVKEEKEKEEKLFFPEKKYASHSPSPSHDFALVRPRSSVSEDLGLTLHSGVSTPAGEREREKEEGWIGFDDSKEKDKDKEKRKGLLHVLSRRRTDSTGSSRSPSTSDSGRGGSMSPTISSTPPSSCDDSGWIEGISLGKKRSVSTPSTTPLFPSLALYPPQMHTHLPVPVPVPTPAPAPAYQTPYFYPYAYGARAMHMPRPVQLPVPVQVLYAQGKGA